MKITRFRASRRGFTLVEIMIVVAIIGLLVAIAVPNYVKTRANAQRQACIENLSQIESAKQIWGVEVGKKDGDPATAADLIGPTLYIKQEPLCPMGNVRYDFTVIGRNATCPNAASGHTL
jgi:prepilin-type N-terminal cleavage/methylation domain-containing protein